MIVTEYLDIIFAFEAARDTSACVHVKQDECCMIVTPLGYTLVRNCEGRHR